MSAVYSLVNVPTLVRDLARHPRGAALCTDLLRAFALTDADLADLDRVRIASDAPALRAEVLGQLAGAPRALAVLAATRDVADSIGLDAWTAAADILDSAPIGGLDDMLRFVRSELLSAAWTAAADVAVARHPVALDVVADAVTASYAADAVGTAVVPLARPWRRWLAEHRHAPAAPTGPALAMVSAVRTATAARLDRAADALRRQRADGWSWPAAMHDACWAVHLTGRGRDAAVAQLAGLRGLLTVTGARPAPALVAAVSCGVHATVVADVLDSATVAAMTAPLHAAVDVCQ